MDLDDVAPHAVDASQAYTRPTFVVSATWRQNNFKTSTSAILFPPPLWCKTKIALCIDDLFYICESQF